MERSTIQRRYGIIGESELVRRAVDRTVQVSPTDLSVLITGESGTGKDVFARAIHAMSRRSGKKLVSLNCGAIPENLLESELFGHERGAFTGAVDRRKGFFEAADLGTIFLDEIGEMPLATQVKLLRVLESGEFSRVGSSDTRQVDVRVLAATNRDLEREVAEGNFRQDLYFRLNAVQIHLPALRERPDDIPLLVEYFGRSVAADLGVDYKGISDDALQVLMNLPWEGNIRELRNVVSTIVTLEKGTRIVPSMILPFVPRVLKAHIPEPDSDESAKSTLIHMPGRSVDQVERELIYKTVLEIRNELAQVKAMLEHGNGRTSSPVRQLTPSFGFEEISDDTGQSAATPIEEEYNLETVEKRLIENALAKFGGNRRKSAVALGISERTLYRKLERYRIP